VRFEVCAATAGSARKRQFSKRAREEHDPGRDRRLWCDLELIPNQDHVSPDAPSGVSVRRSLEGIVAELRCFTPLGGRGASAPT